MDGNVTFDIQVTMNERWVNDFCSMLKMMESFGNIGHSGIIGFFADGDGNFHPKFNIDYPYETTDGIPENHLYPDSKPEILFDAG